MEAYEILGVPEDAHEEQIRAAYKALALKWHPDRQLQNGEQATGKFVEINQAHRTMLRNLARTRRIAKAPQGSTISEPPPPSPPTSASLFASLNRPTRSKTRSRRSHSPSSASSCSPSSSPIHSSQPSRSSSQSREDTPCSPSSSPIHSPRPSRSSSQSREDTPCSPPSSPIHSSQPSRSSSQSREDTPCTSTSSVNSAPISSSDPFINPKSPAPQTDTLRNESNTSDSNPKTFLHRPDESLARDPDFVRDTLRSERSILRGAGADAPKKLVHVLQMTLEEIYQGKTFHFQLIRYKLSGEKSIVPLDVTVPLGSRHGTKVIVTNFGNERKDGTRQDIVFLVKALKHQRFTRVHDDLLLHVRLPWVDSLNKKQGDVRVTGIDGKEYAFPLNFYKTGLLSGTTIIANAGMPRRAGDKRGRIVVRWEISSPHSSWDTLKHVFKFNS